MKRSRQLLTVLLPLVLGMTTVLAARTATAAPETINFTDSRLKVELNATDGDAGLQFFVDGEAWRALEISRPDGSKILDVRGTGVVRDYGLTELFSESSEPPFDVFPFEQFKQLFPEGLYTFRGKTIDGKNLTGSATLTHTVADGPAIRAPHDGAEVGRNDLIVRWSPVNTPAGINIVGYQVLVTRQDPLRAFSADLPASAHKLSIPREFLERGVEYKAEVLAIEASGNQTLTEVAFTVK